MAKGSKPKSKVAEKSDEAILFADLRKTAAALRKAGKKKKSGYRCPVCRADSCGDDLHTITQYAGPELSTGDRLKVILLQVYDLSSRDNLQIAEIKSLFSCLVDEHIFEIDLAEKPKKGKK